MHREGDKIFWTRTRNLLKSLSPVSDNVTDRYYPSGTGYNCDGDDRSHKTVEGEETADGLKTLQAYGVSWADTRPIRFVNMHQNLP